MRAYSNFAEVYDSFMDNVPYDEWSEYIDDLLKKNGIDTGIVVELGCGTGKITRRLKKLGYDMIGIDNSYEMLQIAMEKEEEEEKILYLMQDMREFELYGTANAIICLCDSINYILEKDELLQVFKLVNNYLEKNGIFIFDVNTVYKYEKIIGNRTIAENREDMSLIWENTYDDKKRLNEYDITIFTRDLGDKDGRYRKYEEIHYQRGYYISEIEELIRQAGMEILAIYDELSHSLPTEDSERVYFVVKEGYQKNKKYI